MFRTMIGGALGMAVLVGAARGQEFQDNVILADGTREAKVSVVSEDCSKVVYKLAGGAEKTVAAPDVVDIEYGNAPKEFRGGFEHWRRGNYELAIERFQEKMDEGTMGPAGSNLLGVYGRYYLADALLALGTAVHCRKAASRFREVIEDTLGKDSRFAFAAQLGLGHSLLGAGDAEGARAAFQALAGDGRLDGLPDPARSAFRVEAQLGLADVLAAQGKAKEGQGLCSNALSMAGAAGPEIDSLVRIRAAELAIAANDSAGVRGEYERDAEAAASVADSQDEEKRRLTAVALVATGMARLAEKDHIRAKENFARVAVHFYSCETSHAAALYWAGVLQRRLQAAYEAEIPDVKDEDAKAQKREQAEAVGGLSTQYFRALAARHPRSRWARRCRAGDLG